MNCTPCGFRCQPLPPVLIGKTPTNLHAWREWELGGRCVETDKPNEPAISLQFGRPETPAALIDERRPAISHRVTLGTRERRWEELHDPWIRVQRGERFTVSEPPLP